MNLKELYVLIRDNINVYENKNIKHLYNIIKKYNDNDWKEYRCLNDQSYNKIFVNGNEDFDMYIITWDKFQKSKIHDHSSNGCVFKILEGSITEEHYDNNLKYIGFKKFYEDCIGYIDDYIQLHKMVNYNETVAVTLHIYSPPRHNTTYYDNSCDP